MLRRPFTLIAVAAALCMVAAAMPLQVMLLYGHGPGELDQVFHKLTALNWLVIAGCLITAPLVYRASIFAQLALPSLFAIVAANNFFVGYFATDYSPLSATLATLMFGGLLIPVYVGEVGELFSSPERQWWKSKERIRLSLPIFVGAADAVKYDGATWDISESGLFMPMRVTSLEVNRTVSICLTLGELKQIRCEAKVVRRSGAKGNYPAGVGLQFMNIDRRQRRELKDYLARQK
jgi:hypothetical protein